MRNLVLGPTDTLPNVAIAVRELFRGVNELQDLISVTGQRAEDLSLLSVAFIGEDGKWHRASADHRETSPVTGYGVVTDVSGSTVKLQIAAVVGGFAGLMPGKTYYLGINGAVTLGTDNAVVVALGTAVSSTSILLQPAYRR